MRGDWRKWISDTDGQCLSIINRLRPDYFLLQVFILAHFLLKQSVVCPRNLFAAAMTQLLPRNSAYFFSLLTIALGTATMIPAIHAQDEDDRIDLSQFPGLMVDSVVVPIPSEILEVLDKLGSPNWARELREIGGVNSPDRTRVALLLGTVVAEGFVAVQAQNRDGIEDAGKEVLRLSESLGIKKYVVQHAQSILDAAKANDWDSVRRELDNTERTVRDTMEKMRDEELSQCVSMGGWLRGTEVLTSVINNDYNVDRAELLNQPDLVRHFRKQIDAMRSKKKLKSIASGLDKIARAMGNGDKPVPPRQVKRILGITSGLVKDIVSK
ncbi:MAG: hypothetical protein ACI9R3_001190 [Verrucomicrobiales bacterium]|jgi:hypothetical protein